MAVQPRFRLSTVLVDCPDAHELARFWTELLGWKVVADEPNWVLVHPPGGGTGLSFQSEPGYVPPVWPEGPGDQQKMLHLDVEVDDLDAAGARAIELGARQADYQPQDDTRVFLDPAGHPFCLWVRT